MDARVSEVHAAFIFRVKSRPRRQQITQLGIDYRLAWLLTQKLGRQRSSTKCVSGRLTILFHLSPRRSRSADQEIRRISLLASSRRTSRLGCLLGALIAEVAACGRTFQLWTQHEHLPVRYSRGFTFSCNRGKMNGAAFCV
jgi:hypothetical protein